MAPAFANRLLEVLRSRCGEPLQDRCEAVSLPFKTVLYEGTEVPRYVHFITSGVASVVTLMQGGSAVEVGMHGFEGLPEATYLLGPLTSAKQCVMQVGGSALRMSFSRFREGFLRSEPLRRTVLELVQFEVLSAAQLTACNGLHEVEDRLARWLLMVQDRVGTPDLPLTQEFLGDMLGTRRATVTLAAANLQRAGLIDYRRGNIRVVRRDALEEVACECYGVLSRMRDSLYK